VKVDIPEDRFLVWKLQELLQVCTPAELQQLDTITDRILRLREAEGKPPVNSYIVVNADEPYAGEVRDILKKHDSWG
jgi:hypothetical protein